MKKNLLIKLISVSTALILSSSLIAVPSMADDAADANIDTIMGKMTLYDYEKSSVANSAYFLFGHETANMGDHNSWSRERDMRITSGLAAETLNQDGTFELNNVYKQSRFGSSYSLKKTSYGTRQLTVPDTESGKLFRDEEKYGVFTMPFNYNPQSGMYEYDSAQYKLTANTQSHVLEVSKYDYYNEGLFLPIPSYTGENNYYFGAETELPFVYANGGTVNGKDMVFEFTGDDDVWVYIDGKLALDMGGIHGAISGNINFRTLTVTTTETDAYGYDIVTCNNLEGFDTSVKNHTVKMFYLERGAGFSNFRMAFNLIQPTNYTVKYYDGKYYDGKTGDNGLIASVVHNTRPDGSFIYAGDEIKQNEIKINVNDKTAELIQSNDYYGGFVVDENFMAVTDPNKVVTTVTEDDNDVVYVIFLPKPSYTVTYWTCDEDDKSDSSKWTQVTQKAITGSVDQVIKTSDIDTTVEFDGIYYEGEIVSESDSNGVLGVLSAESPFNVDVLVVQTKKPEPSFTPDPDEDIPGTIGTEYQPKNLKNDNAYIFGRSDTEMQAEDSMHRGEVAAVLYRLLKQNNELDGFVYDQNAAPAFSDIYGRWDRSALEYMNYIGVYSGNSGKILPDQNITRGEAFKMTAIALGYTKDLNLDIEDYTKIFVDLGFVVGDDGGLRLNDPIKRGEFCKIYNLIIGRDKKDLYLPDNTPVTAQTYGFIDLNEDDWYYEIMLKATSSYDENGYVSLELRGIRNELDDYTA